MVEYMSTQPKKGRALVISINNSLRRFDKYESEKLNEVRNFLDNLGFEFEIKRNKDEARNESMAESILANLGFKLVTKRDLSGKQMQSFFQQYVTTTTTTTTVANDRLNSEFILCVMMFHGDSKYTTCAKNVYSNKFENMINECEKLKDKPRLLSLHVCLNEIGESIRK